MTFDQAMGFARRGNKVRCSGMGERWSIFYITSGAAKGYYCLNPHTGSNHAFTPKPEDKTATDWEIMP